MKTLAFVLLGCLPGIAAAQYAPQFGASVAATQDHLIVGEGRNMLLPGTAYVYVRGEDGWELSQKLTPDGDMPRGFGRAIATTSDLLVIGAPLTNEVYIYETNESSEWSLQSVLAGQNEGSEVPSR